MLAKITPAPISFSSSGAIALTEAWVPTGMNIGVSKVPWGAVICPKRAPVCFFFLIKLQVPAGLAVKNAFLLNKHRVTEAKEAVLFCHRMLVGVEDGFSARKGRHKHD